MADDTAEFKVELIDNVTRPARKADGAFARLKKSVQSLSTSVVGKATQKLVGFTKTAITVGATVAGAIAGGLAKMTVGMVDFSQRSRGAFKLLAKDGEVPEQLFQRSIDLAKRFGLDIRDTAKQIQKFRALQFSQDQAEALIKMGTDMQALGASTEEVQRIFAQLGQIKAKDVLQTEELRTLAESGVSTQLVYAALAKQLGKTGAEVRKMVSAGQVNGSQALNAIGSAILAKTGTKEFGEAGKEFADSTLTGMWGKMKSGIQDFFRKVGDTAGPAVTSAAKKLFGAINKFMSSDRASELIQQIGDAMAGLARGVEAAIPFVKELFSGFDAGFSEALKTFGAAFEDVFSMFSDGDGKQSLAIVRAFGQALGNLTVAVGAVALVFGGMVTGLGVAVTYIVESWKGIYRTIVDAIGGVIFGVTNWFADLQALFDAGGMGLGEKALAIGEHIVMGLVNGIKSLATLPFDTLVGIANSAIEGAKTALGISSPSKVFEDIGKNTALGFNKGLVGLPTQNIIHSTLGNDNGMQAQPVSGNLANVRDIAPPGGGGTVVKIDVGGIHVTVGPGTTPQQAREAGEAVAEGFFDACHDYFGGITTEEAV